MSELFTMTRLARPAEKRAWRLASQAYVMQHG
jgi:hypothetical protein